jgi:hypothetical protein
VGRSRRSKSDEMSGRSRRAPMSSSPRLMIRRTGGFKMCYGDGGTSASPRCFSVIVGAGEKTTAVSQQYPSKGTLDVNITNDNILHLMWREAGFAIHPLVMTSH